MKILTLTILMFAATSAQGTSPPFMPGAAPAALQLAQAAQNSEATFRVIDSNGDGAVSGAEFDDRKMEVFYLRDRNRDTFLSREEFSAINQEVFDQADLDGDGRLDGFEFHQSVFVNFESFDGNQDGSITLDEFLAFVDRMQ